MRRDRIIRKMASEVPYVVGEVVTPANPKDKEEWGDTVYVTRICDSYIKFGKKEEWPVSDCPMIVEGYSKKRLSAFFCTPGWLSVLPKNQETT